MAETKKQKKWTPEALRRYRDYQVAFVKETYLTIPLKLNKVSDEDVIAMIKSQPSPTDYLRNLVRSDLKAKGYDPEEVIDQYYKKEEEKAQRRLERERAREQETE